jgi:hypothetical protein
VPVAPPTNDTRWRCAACGNLTRFDVVRSLRLREYVHADLTGATAVEESETLGETVEHVTCRWCGAVDQVELVPRPGASEARADAAPAPASPAAPADAAPAPAAP